MGLLGRKKTKEEKFINKIEKQLQADSNLTLVKVYDRVKAKEKDLKFQRERPPRWCFKPESYQASKDAEITALRNTYSRVIGIDIMDEAHAKADLIKVSLEAKRDKNKSNNLKDIEKEYNDLKLIDMAALVPTNHFSEEPYYKLMVKVAKLDSLKQSLRKQEKKEQLVNTIIGYYPGGKQGIVRKIFGDEQDVDLKMKFLQEKHMDIIHMLSYYSLIDPILTECNKSIRTSAGIVGRNAEEYAKLYAHKLIVGQLFAETLSAQNSFIEEYNKYIQDKREAEEERPLKAEEERQLKEEEERQLKEEEERQRKEEEERQRKEEEERQLKADEEFKSLDAAEYELITSKELGKKEEQNPSLKFLWKLYGKCRDYMYHPIKFTLVKLEDKIKFMKELADWGCLDCMEEFSEMMTIKSSFSNFPNYGATFLYEQNSTLFFECMKVAVLQRLGNICGNPKNNRTMAANKIAEYVKNKRLEWEKNTDRQNIVNNLKSDFWSKCQPETMKNVADKHPYCFAYYEFMNDEVVKTNVYKRASEADKAKIKPGLFSNDDFYIFDSNDTVVLKKYLDGFSYKFKNTFKEKGYENIFDNYYYCLEKYINFRIDAINKINRIKPNPNARYTVDKISDTKYSLKNYTLTRQTYGGQGCWSVAMSKMMESKGIELDQKEIRAYKNDLDKKDMQHYYKDSYHSNTNHGSSIEEHMNLLAKVLPNQIVHQTNLMCYGDGLMTEQLLEAMDNAILKNHTPLPIVYNGHFRIIYGRADNDILMHEPLKDEVQIITAEELAKNIAASIERAATIFWLEDKPETKDGKVVIFEKDGQGLYYDEEGNIRHNDTIEEEVDPDTIIRKYNYYKYSVGEKDFNSVLEFSAVYLTDNRRKNNEPGAEIELDKKKSE